MMGNAKAGGLLCMLMICLAASKAWAQDTVPVISLLLQQKYAALVESKLERWNEQTEKHTLKALNGMVRQEQKMQEKIAKVDSLLAKKLFAYSIDSLQKFKAYITGQLASWQKGPRSYIPYMDTLKQALTFLSKAKEITSPARQMQEQIESSLNAVSSIESKLSSIENLEHYMAGRQQLLRQQLKQYPQLANNLKRINKQAYYYSAQIKQIKQTLQDPSKIEETVLRAVGKLPAFQQLLQRNAALSGLFTSPAVFPHLLQGGSIPIVNGLPSRASLQTFVQSIPSTGTADVAQHIKQQLPDLASGLDQGLHQLQNRLNKAGGGNNKTLPDFKPNSQRTKPLWKRLEYKTDVQFGKSVRYLPATAAVAAGLGYKLNDKSTVGTGMSYTMGLGSGWKNIRFSTQAIGLRTYITWKLKKGLDIQGGTEWNYMLQLNGQLQLRRSASLQQNALLGLHKSYAAGRKLKGNIQVLYDFLHNKHLPGSQPVLFRFGYSL